MNRAGNPQLMTKELVATLGVQRNEIGNVELEYREVIRQTIVETEPF